MTYADFLEFGKMLVRDYGSFLTGALGLILTCVFGGSLFYKLAQHRIKHLEEQLEAEQAATSKARSDLVAQSNALAETEKERNGIKSRLARIQLAFSETNDEPIWMGSPINRPDQYDRAMPKSIPIVLVANLKGGVGKSTIATNLVSYFEDQHQERVLAIDLDHQGSMSSMLLPEPYNRKARQAQTIKDLIGGNAAALTAIAAARPVRDSKTGSRIIDCDSPFANFETRLQLQWLSGEAVGDIRYNLARALLDQSIQSQFDRVVIDAPPRMTTGLMNALCASTHLIVPFVLDTLSAERVGLFLAQLKQMSPTLFPHLGPGAVVGTMKRTDTDQIGNKESEAFAEAKKGVREVWGAEDFVLTHAPIPRKQCFADAAGLRSAYNDSLDAKKIFKRLGDEIYKRAPGRDNADRIATQAAE
jgi:cellulose biosynthesis protein BcsQ